MCARRGNAALLTHTFVATSPLAAQIIAQQSEKGSKPAFTSLLDKPARTEVQDTPLAQALAELQHRSGVPLAFSPSLLARAGSVTCHCNLLTVGQALDQLLSGTPFTYAELAGQVLVERRSEER